jgi:hypothetical protein
MIKSMHTLVRGRRGMIRMVRNMRRRRKSQNRNMRRRIQNMAWGHEAE